MDAPVIQQCGQRYWPAPPTRPPRAQPPRRVAKAQPLDVGHRRPQPSNGSNVPNRAAFLDRLRASQHAVVLTPALQATEGNHHLMTNDAQLVLMKQDSFLGGNTQSFLIIIQFYVLRF